MVRHLVLSLIGDTRAATAVEYGLLLGLMVIAIVGGITAVGAQTTNNIDSAAQAYPT
ncbi:Flp family type IVb pilin [Henriciella sp. AS95]|uniref:Flp family type IVb pilin n=1 Tax=Henriciella sp. AS95 TaxID=3135782 RepID=UPI00317B8AE0